VNKVIDTVGAGDTFNAGIILYLSLYPNANLQQALQFACQLASKKVAQQGFDSLKEKI
jgi:ketohexokinase